MVLFILKKILFVTRRSNIVKSTLIFSFVILFILFNDRLKLVAAKEFLDLKKEYPLLRERVELLKDKIISSLFSKIDKVTSSDYVEVNLFYATNRKYEKYVDEYYKYGFARDTKINYGKANILIKKTKDLNLTNTKPPWFVKYNKDKITTNEIVDIENLKKREYFHKINSLIDKNQNQTILFIHGFNVSFNSALQTTAEIVYNIDFQGVALTFSWPSKGEFSSYLSDEASAKYSIEHFKNFLLEIRKNIKTRKFHILAHSMGNRVLINALSQIKEDLKIDQIILAAPDIDSQIFTEQLAPKIKNKAKQITMYVSSNDKALELSMELHEYPRAGYSKETITITNGIDTIDASEVNTDLLGHTFFKDEKALLIDLKNIIDYSLSPNERKLTKIYVGEENYWKLLKSN